jgi:succinate dehydrogenase / fumarate reductase flavoprotein subunit
MSESLRNDGRVWVPKKMDDVKAIRNKTKKGVDIPEADRDYYLERMYPAFGNLVPRGCCFEGQPKKYAMREGE